MLYLSTMTPAALVEFALAAFAALNPEPAALRVAARRIPRLSCCTRSPGLRELTEAARTAQHAAILEACLAVVVLAVCELERTGRFRRGCKCVRIREVIDRWDAWGGWLGRKSAAGISAFLTYNAGRPCGAPGPAAGWGLVRRERVPGDRVRYSVRYYGT